MKERPILFTSANVRAILEDRKTQTRRVVKPQPPSTTNAASKNLIQTGWRSYEDQGSWKFGFCSLMPDGTPSSHFEILNILTCPYGVPGDRLWARETFTLQCDVDGDEPPFSDGRPIQRMPDDFEVFRWLQPHYKATDPTPKLCCEKLSCINDDPHCHWKPSIHMPRWASRITLEITEVRVQRLQEISEADAQREGWAFEGLDLNQSYDPVVMDTARQWFRGLWDSINAKRGFNWEVNPWVWALTFKRVSA